MKILRNMYKNLHFSSPNLIFLWACGQGEHKELLIIGFETGCSFSFSPKNYNYLDYNKKAQ